MLLSRVACWLLFVDVCVLFARLRVVGLLVICFVFVCGMLILVNGFV